MADYRRDLAAWEAEKTRQQYEFTINDPNAVSTNTCYNYNIIMKIL